MKYDFDKIIERKGTGSTKWDLNEKLFGTDDVGLQLFYACDARSLDSYRERTAVAVRFLKEHIIGIFFQEFSDHMFVVFQQELMRREFLDEFRLQNAFDSLLPLTQFSRFLFFR